MHLRKAKTEEFLKIQAFYWNLIEQMKNQAETIGRKKGIYPSDEFLTESIARGELYVLDDSAGYSACVVVNSAYNEGYDGCPWHIDCAPEELLVPHALAVHPEKQGQGIGKIVVQDILTMAKAAGKKAVRLDILGGNRAAERLYTKMGFRYVQAKPMFYADTGWTEYVMFECVL